MSELDLKAVITADARSWIKATGAATKAIEDLKKASEKTASSVAKNFKKTEAAGGSLKKFIGAGLAVAFGIHLANGIKQAVGRLKEFVKSSIFAAARAEQMSAVLGVLGERLGYSTRQMDEYTEGIRKSGIEMGVAQNTLAEFIRYNMDAAQATELARVAQDAAVMSNSNSSATLQRLIYGISTQNSLLLRNAGVQVMAGAAISAYAGELGKAESAMTSTERTQAVLNAVLKEGGKLSGAYERSMEEPIKKLGSLTRIVDDIKMAIGAGLYPAFKTLINEGLDPFVKWIKSGLAEGTAFNQWITSLGQSLSDVSQALFTWATSDEVQDNLKKMGQAFFKLANVVGDIVGPMVKAAAAVTTFTGSKGFKLLTVSFSAFAAVVATLLAGPLAAIAAFFVTSMVLKFAVGMAVATVNLIMHTAALARTKLAQFGFTSSTAASTVAVTAFGMAANLAIPIIGLFVAALSMATMLKSNTDRAKEFTQAVEGITSALYDQNGMLNSNEKAWRDYLTGIQKDLHVFGDESASVMNLTVLDLENLVRSFQDGGSNIQILTDYFERMGWVIDDISLENLADEIEGIAKASRRSIMLMSQMNLTDLYAESMRGFSGDMISEFDTVSGFILDGLDDIATALELPTDINWDEWLGDKETSYEDLLYYQGAYNDLLEEGETLHLAYNRVLSDAADKRDLLNARMQALGAGLSDEIKEGLAETEQAFATSAVAMENLGDRISLTSGFLWDMVDSSNGVYDSVDAMAQVMFVAGDAQRASGNEAKQLALMLRDVGAAAFASAANINAANEDANGYSDATAVLQEELAKARNSLIEAGEAAGYTTDSLIRLFDTMMQLDGSTAVLDIIINFGGMNTSSLDAAIASIDSQVAGLSGSSAFSMTEGGGWGVSAELGTLLKQLATLKAVRDTLKSPEFTQQPWSGGGGGGGLSETERLWEEILGSLERSRAALKSGRSSINGYLSATERVESAEDRINNLLDYRNDLLAEGSDFAADYEVSLARQRNSLVSMQRAYDALIERQAELTPESIADQETSVADLIAMAQEVTAIEQGLMDQGLITGSDAAADITAAEAAAIEEASNALRGAERQYSAGIITAAQYQAAQDALATSIADAISPSEDLLAAQELLNGMLYDAETITDDLIIAQADLNGAAEIVAEALSVEEAAARALEEVDLLLIDATKDLNEALWDQEEALREIASNAENVELALAGITAEGGRLATAFEGVADALVLANEQFPQYEEYQAAADAITPSTPQTVLALQQSLLSAGYNPGPLDGIMGPKTRAAIAARASGAATSTDSPWQNPAMLAKGGIITRATAAVIGESGPEAVIPLSRLGDMIGGRGGSTYNINVGAGLSDPSAVAEAVVDALRAYERVNGPVPVTTQASMYTTSASS